MKGRLVSARHHPCNPESHLQSRCLEQSIRTVLEVRPLGQAEVARNEDVVQENVGVLRHAARNLPEHLLSPQALRALLDDESLHLVVFLFVPRPHDDIVGKSCISDPSLHSVEAVATGDLFGGRLQVGGIGAIGRLCQPKADGLFQFDALGEDARPLLVVAESIDNGHAQTVLNQESHRN